MQNPNKIVLAYSGGLDTSIILKWLSNKGYDVICFVGNVGQDDDFELIRKKAIDTGASKVYIDDLREEFVTDYIFAALKATGVADNTVVVVMSDNGPWRRPCLNLATRNWSSAASRGIPWKAASG